MNWLFKSEPETFGIERLQKEKVTSWDGVRNYQARNFMRDAMKKGELGFFYHSNCAEPGIVGVVEIVKESHPDTTALDPESQYYDPKSTMDNPRWYLVDVKFKQKFPQPITLTQLKNNPKLKDMLILRKGNRLSITPVTDKQWQAVLAML